MSPPRTDTFTAHPANASAALGKCEYLFLVLEGARPAAGGARYCLHDIAAVRIGRSHQTTATITDRILTIGVADRKLSSAHARIERSLTGWELVDDGSKNGSFVAGKLVARAKLYDGAEFELGQSLFTFRDQWTCQHSRPILYGADLAAKSAGLTTMLPQLAEELDRVALVAESSAPIRLFGETGTGKEILARAIHERSGRTGAFVALNCGAIPAGLVENELFGHRRGAFSGADSDRPGYIRQAAGGTLLLDEIGDLPLAAQAALLRVLNEREVVPVGETGPIPVDFRLISATHRDLEAMVAEGLFREDLLARLGGFRFTLPPLRERREDVGLILQTVAARSAAVPPLSIDVVRQLFHYSWPHNIRELTTCLATATALSVNGAIDLDQLPPPIAAAPAIRDSADSSTELRSELVKLLREHRGNVSAIARARGKARMQIQRWLKRYALDPDHYRDE